MLTLLSQLVLALPILASPLVSRQTQFRQYRITNNCPTETNLYVGGQYDTTIPSLGTYTRFDSLGAGFFYTDANGGNGSSVGTTRAGFLSDYYYIVTDPNHVNVGMSISPRDRQPDNGFCQTIACDYSGCQQAFTQPPTRFPPESTTAPNPPYFRCPIANTTYDITFCPTFQFPIQSHAIKFQGRSKCLDVRGAVFANGTPVQLYDCNDTNAQRWVINHGSTKVKLAGTDFCLDAGSTPGNGVELKIWQCYDNLPAQQWFYTEDNRLALEGQGLCTDLENGNLANSAKVQTWQCSDNNPNQAWTI